MNLPQKTSGNTFAEQAFNSLVDGLKSLRPMRGSGTMTRHTPFGVSRRATAVAQMAGAGGGQMFQTHEVFGDYFSAFLCNTNTGEVITEGQLYHIAKWFEYRTSFVSESFDGNVVDYDFSIDDGTGNYRTATNGTVTETHVMIPRYKPNTVDTDVQFVFAIKTNGTGVAEVDSQSGQWLEIPARVWAVQYTTPS